jgi:hypothetical protein
VPSKLEDGAHHPCNGTACALQCWSHGSRVGHLAESACHDYSALALNRCPPPTLYTIVRRPEVSNGRSIRAELRCSRLVHLWHATSVDKCRIQITYDLHWICSQGPSRLLIMHHSIDIELLSEHNTVHICGYVPQHILCRTVDDDRIWPIRLLLKGLLWAAIMCRVSSCQFHDLKVASDSPARGT